MKQEDQFTVLVVGCGNMGTSHARAYSLIERVKLLVLLAGAVKVGTDYQKN